MIESETGTGKMELKEFEEKKLLCMIPRELVTRFVEQRIRRTETDRRLRTQFEHGWGDLQAQLARGSALWNEVCDYIEDEELRGRVLEGTLGAGLNEKTREIRIIREETWKADDSEDELTSMKFIKNEIDDYFEKVRKGMELHKKKVSESEEE